MSPTISVLVWSSLCTFHFIAMLGYRTFKTELSSPTAMGDCTPPSTVGEDVDVAALLADRLGEETFSRTEENSLRWKLDFRLVPILWLNVTFAAVDKVSTATAALYGMRADCHLTGDRYAWVGSAFYVSQDPMNLSNVESQAGS